MKKICLLLSAVLLLGCLAGCQRPAGSDHTTEPLPIENEDGTLSQWMKDEIKTAYEQNGSSWGAWWDEGDKHGPRYYGTYNGYVILFREGYAEMEAHIVIADYKFRYSMEFRLFAYKSGEFHMLKDVYEQGFVSDETIKSIWEVHQKH